MSPHPFDPMSLISFDPIDNGSLDDLPFRRFQTNGREEFSDLNVIERVLHRPLYQLDGQIIGRVQILLIGSPQWKSKFIGTFVYQKGIGDRDVLDKEHIDFIWLHKIRGEEPSEDAEIRFVKTNDTVIAEKFKSFTSYRWNTSRSVIRVLD